MSRTTSAIDQRQLNPELSEWLDERQRSLKIVKTTTTPAGKTLDWVPIESQVASGRIASPPPQAAAVAAGDAQRFAQAVRSELDSVEFEKGPPGSVPILRPDLSGLTRTVALKDYLRKGRPHLTPPNDHASGPTDPYPFGYFHNISNQNGAFFGGDGSLNVWKPAINSPPGPGDDHSIIQFWLLNTFGAGGTQSVEGGWTVDQSLNGDTNPHIFVFYTTNNYGPVGNNISGYNAQFSGWVQYSSPSTTGSVWFPGIGLAPVSSWGGPQFEASMKFQLYKEPTSGLLNWWVAVQGVWMGYYPASLFSGALSGQAANFQCGGEVFSSLANPALTQDQMGSGWQAQAGWTKAAYVRNLRAQTDLAGTMAASNGQASSDVATVGGADPYNIQLTDQSATNWNTFFYVGGPIPLADDTATFNQITFTIGTGGDDLRGDSSATATVALPGGAQTFTLKGQHDPSWGNNSTNVKTFPIVGPAQLLAAFGAITIALTSHNSVFQTDDNWNIQTANITVSGPGGSAVLFDQGGNPLARLTGSAPSVALQPVAGA
jgi:hypothetical protein